MQCGCSSYVWGYVNIYIEQSTHQNDLLFTEYSCSGYAKNIIDLFYFLVVTAVAWYVLQASKRIHNENVVKGIFLLCPFYCGTKNVLSIVLYAFAMLDP